MLDKTHPDYEEYQLRARRSPWLAYPLTVVPAILPWHESKAHYRVLSGPNGCGKSTAGAADFVSYALGYNPIRHEEYEVPNVCWGVCVEYNSSGRVMYRKIADMLPRDKNGKALWKWYKQEHLFVLSNGSHIAIKSQKEGESSLLGERCRAIWIDEAMGGERGEENFGELQARGLPDQPLDMLFTLTPKLDIGLDWMRRKLWQEPGREAHPDFIPGTFCLDFGIDDCSIEKGGFHTQAYIADRKLKTDPDEAEARLYGKWTPFTARPAFAWKLLLACMERAPKSKRASFAPRGYGQQILEYLDSGHGKVQRERETAHNYIIAWDPSSGLGRGHDPSALVVLDRADLAVVYHAARNDMGPEDFARKIALPAAKYYNTGLLVVETNGEGGGAAISACKDYENLYSQLKIDSVSGAKLTRFGWHTNEQSRGRMIDSLLRALTEDKWTPCYDLLEEMSHIVKKQVGDRVKVIHDDGFHDDLTMATGMALAVHYEEPVYEMPDYSKIRIRYGPSNKIFANDVTVSELSV